MYTDPTISTGYTLELVYTLLTYNDQMLVPQIVQQK